MIAKGGKYTKLVGMNVKLARIKAGLSQEELAEKVGKKRAYIARIEKGETDMQLSSFISISQALGIKLKTEY